MNINGKTFAVAASFNNEMSNLVNYSKHSRMSKEMRKSPLERFAVYGNSGASFLRDIPLHTKIGKFSILTNHTQHLN